MNKELDRINWQIEGCEKDIFELKRKLLSEVNKIDIATYFDADVIATYGAKLSEAKGKYEVLRNMRVAIESLQEV